MKFEQTSLPITIKIKFDVELSLCDAIKLRIAGKHYNAIIDKAKTEIENGYWQNVTLPGQSLKTFNTDVYEHVGPVGRWFLHKGNLSDSD